MSKECQIRTTSEGKSGIGVLSKLSFPKYKRITNYDVKKAENFVSLAWKKLRELT